MPELHCPGQDMRCWKPDDICYIKCPSCGGEIEFWKDEPVRACPSCHQEMRNPRQDCGCSKWCSHSLECLLPVLAPQTGTGPGSIAPLASQPIQ